MGGVKGAAIDVSVPHATTPPPPTCSAAAAAAVRVRRARASAPTSAAARKSHLREGETNSSSQGLGCTLSVCIRTMT